MPKKELTIQLTVKQKEQMRKATGEAPDMVKLEIDGKELRVRPVWRDERIKD